MKKNHHQHGGLQPTPKGFVSDGVFVDSEWAAFRWLRGNVSEVATLRIRGRDP